MADLDILPTWAANYLREHILEHAHVLNALPIEEGPRAGSYLLNTSRGAMMLAKKRLGEPRHWLLPLPGDRFDFTCEVCEERLGLVNPTVPRVVHCPHCATAYTLVEDLGTIRLVRGEEDGVRPPGPWTEPEPWPEPASDPAAPATAGEDDSTPEDPAPQAAETPESMESIDAAVDAAVAGTTLEPPERPPVYRDFQGDVHPVLDVEGIGPVYAQKLEELGVKTTARLCYEDADDLARRVDAPARTVRRWQTMAQLMKVHGVGPQYAEALARADVDVDALKRRSAARVAADVNAYLDGLETNVLGHAVTERRVARWQEAAKPLRRVRQPVPPE